MGSTTARQVEPSTAFGRLAKQAFLATLWKPGSATNLAVVRITLCVSMFGIVGEVVRPVAIGDPSSIVAPDLLGPLLTHLPRDPLTLRLVALGAGVSLLFGALGVRTRWAMGGVLFFLSYRLGVTQIFGKVDHDHHVLWIAFVLALSPCGDALSFDARGAPDQRSVRYGFPLRAIWALLGMAYLFPGLWKLTLEPSWSSAANMSNIMWGEWTARQGYDPILFVADQRLLLSAAAIGAIVIEISFIVLVFWDRTRTIAPLLGLAFHIGVGLTIGIWFLGLAIFYGAFVDWAALLARGDESFGGPRRPRADPDQGQDPPGVTSAVLIGGLLLAVLFAGAARIVDGWPVASYPDFAYLAAAEQLRPTIEDAEGNPIPVDQVLPALTPIERHRYLVRVWRGRVPRPDFERALRDAGACDLEASPAVLSIHEDRVISGQLREGPTVGSIPLDPCR